MDARYPAVLEPETGGGFFVRFVDLEDAFAEGASLDEAPFNGAEVLSALLGCRLDHDLPIPDPSPAGDGLYLIAPDVRTQAALPIRRARGERSLAELARSLETSWPSAGRRRTVARGRRGSRSTGSPRVDLSTFVIAPGNTSDSVLRPRLGVEAVAGFGGDPGRNLRAILAQARRGGGNAWGVGRTAGGMDTGTVAAVSVKPMARVGHRTKQ